MVSVHIICRQLKKSEFEINPGKTKYKIINDINVGEMEFEI
jgi:hypothetical protein